MENTENRILRADAPVTDSECGYVRPDDETALRETVEEKCRLLSIPGMVVQFDPEEAELLGAFEDNAISEKDVMEAVYDLRA